MRLSVLPIGFLVLSVLSACGGGSGDPPPADDVGVSETTIGTMTIGENNTGETITGGSVPAPAVYATPDGVEQCSVDDIKGRVDFDMRDYYIYYDQVPTLNLANYDSGNALIQDLRVLPDTFSSVRDAATQTALFDEGKQQDHGIWFQPSSDGVVRFRNIDIGSPAFEAGILRGDELITFNGITLSELTSDDINTALDADNFDPLVLTIRTGDEEPRTVSIIQEEYSWQTAAALNRFTPRADESLPIVGYLSVSAFLEPTRDEIDRALQLLEGRGGFDELIVDLRYNGGGRTSVARYLSSIVGGDGIVGQVMFENQWNDKYADFNSTELFEAVDKPLNSPRVFVLTTGSTASSSEIFINSLKPYIDVVVIGDRTAGKPFSSRGRDYCDKTINAMLSIRVNSAGMSVDGGIAADCLVDDSWNTTAQSTDDPLVAAALRYASGNGCATDIVADANSVARNAPTGPTYRPKQLWNFASDD